MTPFFKLPKKLKSKDPMIQPNSSQAFVKGRKEAPGTPKPKPKPCELVALLWTSPWASCLGLGDDPGRGEKCWGSLFFGRVPFSIDFFDFWFFEGGGGE